MVSYGNINREGSALPLLLDPATLDASAPVLDTRPGVRPLVCGVPPRPVAVHGCSGIRGRDTGAPVLVALTPRMRLVFTLIAAAFDSGHGSSFLAVSPIPKGRTILLHIKIKMPDIALAERVSRAAVRQRGSRFPA